MKLTIAMAASVGVGTDNIAAMVRIGDPNGGISTSMVSGTARRGSTAVASIEERRRMVRRLIGRGGRGLAESYGFQVTNSPSNLFGVLCLSILLNAGRDHRRAVAVAQALRDRGWNSAAPLARSSDEERLAVLREAGVGSQAPKLSGTLRDLAGAVVDRYRGDLRRLRGEAGQEPGRERQLLKQLPGVDDAVVDAFFREVQAPWREIAPFVDRRALTAARKLGLGRTPAELSEVAGGRGSEKIAWLAGALVRVDLEKSYDTVRQDGAGLTASGRPSRGS